MSRRFAVVAVGVAMSGLVVGCGSSGSGDADAASAATSKSPGVSAAPESAGSTSAAASPSASDAPVVEIPPGPEAGTDAAVAWEALMGPDGEYAAAASYSAVIDSFGEVQPYVDIKAAEERHINALIRQLDRLDVQAPPNPYLGKLTAPADLGSAAQAWAAGEVLNVEMYDQLLTQTSDATLVRVLGNLRRASQESHLPLFELAAANGGTLSPEQMTGVQAGA